MLQVIVTDSVGLEGAFSENITDRRFGPHLTLEYTGYEAGMRQLRWLEDTLSQPKGATWRIVVGHRPVLSGACGCLQQSLQMFAKSLHKCTC